MALLDDFTKGATTPAGLAVSVGAVLLAPVLVPAVSRALRPVTKAVLRTGISVYRGAVEPLSAAVGNLVTEVQLEMAASSAGAAPPAASPADHDAPPRGAHKRRGNHQQ